jgi:hypothetical protein
VNGKLNRVPIVKCLVTDGWWITRDKRSLPTAVTLRVNESVLSSFSRQKWDSAWISAFSAVMGSLVEAISWGNSSSVNAGRLMMVSTLLRIFPTITKPKVPKSVSNPVCQSGTYNMDIAEPSGARFRERCPGVCGGSLFPRRALARVICKGRCANFRPDPGSIGQEILP